MAHTLTDQKARLAFPRLMTPTSARERGPVTLKRASLGGGARPQPSYRRFPSTPRISAGGGCGGGGGSPQRVKDKVTTRMLERADAQEKIVELESVLREICQSGFDEAYLCNEEEAAGRLASEFVRNLKNALTRLIDRFRSRYLKARRATHDMFSDESQYERSNQFTTTPLKRNKLQPLQHTSTETLPVAALESEDSVTTATSNFFRPNTSRSAMKPLRLLHSPPRSRLQL